MIPRFLWHFILHHYVYFIQVACHAGRREGRSQGERRQNFGNGKGTTVDRRTVRGGDRLCRTALWSQSKQSVLF